MWHYIPLAILIIILVPIISFPFLKNIKNVKRV